MPKRAMSVPFITLMLNPAGPEPLHRQLYSGLREAILGGRLAAGARLPATRTLAAQLGISRNTVANAFEQLLTEGYLEGRVGDGTYVTRALPDDLGRPGALAAGGEQPEGGPRAISQRGAALSRVRVSAAPELGGLRAFRLGPDGEAFPLAVWSRLLSRRWRHPPRELLGYGDPAGYRPLREAIAGYLAAARGIRCSVEQVIVVSGSQQGLDLAAQVLLDPGDSAWIEEPGYLGARGALIGAGARLVPVPVDGDGLCVADGVSRCPEARLAYITPSHQFPLGVTMSLSRRLALLEWARAAGAWVLEDDFDSEFRYAGRPLAALQGLDGAGRVIYIGTFSKVLLPALRLGYLVVPPDLVDVFVAARALADRHSPNVEQAALADFIGEGHFARHIRRMRSSYAERQAILCEAVGRDLRDLLSVRPTPTGMHVVGWLAPGIDDRAAVRAAALCGVETQPLSAYALEARSPGGLLLGYTAVGGPELRDGVHRLAEVLHHLSGDSPTWCADDVEPLDSSGMGVFSRECGRARHVSPRRPPCLRFDGGDEGR